MLLETKKDRKNRIKKKRERWIRMFMKKEYVFKVYFYIFIPEKKKGRKESIAPKGLHKNIEAIIL